MKPRQGDWRVVRDCCKDGSCLYCFQRPSDKPKLRVTHVENVTARHANLVAGGLLDYFPTVEKMR